MRRSHGGLIAAFVLGLVASATVRGAVMNVFDRRYAYNFGNPFSGTHFGAPRTASLSLLLAF